VINYILNAGICLCKLLINLIRLFVSRSESYGRCTSSQHVPLHDYDKMFAEFHVSLLLQVWFVKSMCAAVRKSWSFSFFVSFVWIRRLFAQLKVDRLLESSDTNAFIHPWSLQVSEQFPENARGSKLQKSGLLSQCGCTVRFGVYNCSTPRCQLLENTTKLNHFYRESACFLIFFSINCFDAVC